MSNFNINDLKVTKTKGTKSLFKTDAIEVLRNKKIVAQGLAEAIIDGDEEAFHEIMRAYLSVVNREELSRRSGIPIGTVKRISSGANVGIDKILKVMSAVNQELAI